MFLNCIPFHDGLLDLAKIPASSQHFWQAWCGSPLRARFRLAEFESAPADPLHHHDFKPPLNFRTTLRPREKYQIVLLLRNRYLAELTARCARGSALVSFSFNPFIYPLLSPTACLGRKSVIADRNRPRNADVVNTAPGTATELRAE